MNIKGYFHTLVVCCITALIADCSVNNTVQKTAVSIASTAYYTVYRDSANGDWQTRLNSYSNTKYRAFAIAFTVDKPDSPYSVGFVCPSTTGSQGHEVYLYYATPAEMNTLNFSCNQANSDTSQRAYYGKIDGLKIKTSPNSPTAQSVGEKAYLALADTSVVQAWEAYATMEQTGTRDVVGYTQNQEETNAWKHSGFYIRRNAASGTGTDPLQLDISFTSGTNVGYYKPFDPLSQSQVDISGVNSSDVIDASVGFLSTNKTYLPLSQAQGKITTLNFLPVPLDPYTGGALNSEFNPGEGHELLVQAVGSDGQTERSIRKFFTVSNHTTQNVALPKALDVQPVVGLYNKGKVQQLVLNWSQFSDSAAGYTRMYRWKFKATAADAEPDHPAAITTGETDWIVNVTSGWLQATQQGSSNYSLAVPTDLSVYAVDAKGNPAYTWHQEWSLKASTSVDWEFTTILTNKAFRVQDVVNFNLNRDFNILTQASDGTYESNDFDYAESYARGVTKPSP